MAKKEKKILSLTLCLRKHILYDLDFWYISMTSQNDDISTCFFHFFKILIFQVVSWVKVQKMAQNNKNSVPLTLYLSNCTSYDCGFW